MQYASLSVFLSEAKPAYAKGPIAIVFVEDDVEVESALRHHLKSGFRAVIMMADSHQTLAEDLEEQVHHVIYNTAQPGAVPNAMNTLIAAAPGVWMYYCYNAEFLFYPFSESRTVGEMIAFNVEERRDTIMTYVVDLYARDLVQNPSGVDVDAACLDKSGYYALARKDAWNNDLDRQMDFYGGLRWRFEEHVPAKRRRIDRVALFKAKPGLKLQEDHTFNDPEYNTYSCPWHHNITAAIASFRTAKALKRNPGSTFEIESFRWHNSTPFEWRSRQLLDLGLMEPGQWF